MGIEIERKFLVASDDWRKDIERSQRLVQGYLDSGGAVSVRVRLAGDRANLNMKGRTVGARRLEFEYAIPVADARVMLEELAGGRLIEKTRHLVRHGDRVWEVDEFAGRNAGLVVAELELSAEDEAFPRPVWLGEEVTEDPRYYNACLVDRPFATWSRDEGAD